MYFICDIYDANKYGKIMNRKQLYELMVDEITDDLKNNHREYEIVISCVNQLNELAKNNLVSDNYIIDALESFGWKVLDLLQIQRDLEDLKEYFSQNEENIGEDFNKVIEKINKGVK